MSEKKHTPGPFTAVKNPDDHAGANAASIYSESGIYVADVYRGYVGSEEVSEQEQMANAELFAAAPETAAERDRLRAENERLREVLEKIADNTHDEESREIARAALAKAEAAQ